MMYDAQQSDGAILAGKAANKGARAPAEPLERRAPAERNPQRTGTVRTQSRGAVSPGAERIRQYVERKPGEKLIALLHHITPEALEAAYLALKRDAAPGVDGVTWREYGDGLDERLLDLHGRVQPGSVPGEARQAGRDSQAGRGNTAARYCLAGGQNRSAGGGGQSPEPDFRIGVLRLLVWLLPGRSAHDALDALAYVVERRKVSWRRRGGHPGVLRQHRPGAADVVSGDAHRGPAGVAPDTKVAERRRHGRGAGSRLCAGDAARSADIAAACERVPAQRARRLVRARVATAGGPGPSSARRTSCGMPMTSSASTATMRCGSWRHGGSGSRLTGWSCTRRRPVYLSSAGSRWRTGGSGGEGRPETFDFLGLTHYCRTRRDGPIRAGAQARCEADAPDAEGHQGRVVAALHDKPVKTGQWLGRVLPGGLATTRFRPAIGLQRFAA